MVEYVLGFCFTEDGKVLLMNKLRPEWQAGKVNGVGGKIEPFESSHDAMIREFWEETGVRIREWRSGFKISKAGWTMFVFSALVKEQFVTEMRDESTFWWEVGTLPENVIPNLHWIIPLLKDGITIGHSVTIEM